MRSALSSESFRTSLNPSKDFLSSPILREFFCATVRRIPSAEICVNEFGARRCRVHKISYKNKEKDNPKQLEILYFCKECVGPESP